VPVQSGQKQHLRPSNVVTITMYTLGVDEAHPLVLVLPLRTVRLTFPTLKSDGKTYVRFDGFFGLQLSDPWWLWKFLRDFAPNTPRLPRIAAATGSTTAAVYGTFGSFAPTPDTGDGSTTVVNFPFAYIDGTTNVYVNGAFKRPGTDYTESDPKTGEITFVSAPATGAALWGTCLIAGGYG
jgi:hypothetical protein